MVKEKGNVVLSESQAGWVAWALDAMGEYWEAGSDACHDAGLESAPDMPTLTGRTLSIVGIHPEVIDDLIYRLADMAPNMSIGLGREEAAHAQVAVRAAEKIKAQWLRTPPAFG